MTEADTVSAQKKAIGTMEGKTNAAELFQFIHRCRWMSTCIPEFHKKLRTVDSRLEKAYASVRRRKQNSLKLWPFTNGHGTQNITR